MKYSILTFGCRVNQADSLRLEAELSARGGCAAAPEHADVVVVNTCSVTATADQGARQAIRRLHRLNPEARIVTTGCYATRDPDAVESLPGVVASVPNEAKDRLAEELVGLAGAEGFGGDGDGACGAAVSPGVAGRTAWTLRVQTGCDEACAYCIIPATRGRSRSRPMSEVCRELEQLAEAGFKEVVITGVHLGAYGRDLDPPTSLSALLARIAARHRGLFYRISSLEPMDLAPDIVELVASAGVFAPHFHLPLQHGSDAVLSAMRRPYTVAQYGRVAHLVRSRLPHAAIGSDIIVGFPGETDAAFEESLAYLRHSPLTHLHVFAYSDRPGTVASRLPAKVHGSVVRERAAAVRDVGRALATAFRRRQAGSTRRALTLDTGTSAVTDNYIKVSIPPGHRRNEWIEVCL